MDKTNIELFKQALIEGVNRRIDRDIAACEENVVCSRKHNKAMARILKGKTPSKPINRKMIAILVAASILLLAGCAIIYHDEIRGFITDVSEFFVDIRFEEGENESKYIEEVYELTYVPDGYELKTQESNEILASCIFVHNQGYSMKFTQRPLDDAFYTVDSEQSPYELINIRELKVYYQKINLGYCYLWNDGKYAFKLNSTQKLSVQELELIIDGIKVK